jgi:imidazole glycerol-phosphate synthase subunit HisH
MVLKIVKYNAGNIQSVLFALERIGVQAEVTDDIEKLQSADKVIFPGVGEASTAMQYLKARNLDKVIKELRQPVLGVCLGMQLMCAYSEENDTKCLGIFEEKVKRFVPPPLKGSYKVPQIGWNKIYDVRSDLMKGVNEAYCYFVHGYYVPICDETIAVTDYIQPYSSALNKRNFYGVQFHAEKSADAGEQILTNFIQMKPWA